MASESDWSSPAAADSVMLGAIIDTSGSVILGLTIDHRIFAWNRAAEKLYQTPRAQAIGMDYVRSFLAPEHQDAVAADIQQVLAGKRTLNFEDDSLLPDGSRRTLIWNVTRVLDATGAPYGIVATGQDITERKEAEERFRLIFEHALDGLLLTDTAGVIDCNPAALRILGLTDKSQLIGRQPAEFSPESQPDGAHSERKSRELGTETLERGAHTFDWVHQRPDGALVPVEVSVRHAMLGGRRVSVVAWRDRSRRAELERARQEIEHRLNTAHKMEAVGQLAGGVAHDFNNLLAAIRNSIQLAMYEVPVEFGIRQDLEEALQTTERASRLTGQLLAFSRPQSRAAGPVNIAALVREIAPLLTTSLPPDVSVRVDADVVGATVRVDQSQFEQVVLNLVLNARDAMPSGGELSLTVRVDVESRTVSLLVSDTGVGMDALTQERIFEPFFTTKPVGSGTGLGLAVVYGVVTQVGGTVRADSAPGRGTQFHVVLPLSDERPAESAVSAGVSAGVVAARAGTVLLVDDDAAVRMTTRRLLQHRKFTVLEATNGEEALRVFTAERAHVNVILTDVRMPVMDGVRLAKAVRAIDPGFPIIFFSGYDEIGVDVAQELHDVPLLAKPFTLERLIAALRAAMSIRTVA